MQQTDEEQVDVTDSEQGIWIIANWLREEMKRFAAGGDYASYGTMLIRIEVQKAQMRKVCMHREVELRLPLPFAVAGRAP